MKALTAFFAAAFGAGALLAQTVDQNKLKPLHDAGRAFEKGLEDPGASVEEVRDLRQKLDREAAVSAGSGGDGRRKKGRRKIIPPPPAGTRKLATASIATNRARSSSPISIESSPS